jgi:hypothetical protein
MQGVDGELNGVARSGRQPTEFVNQLVAGESGSLLDCFLADEFSERRTTGNRGDTAFGQESDFGDLAISQGCGEFQDVTTSWVFQLH